MTTDQEYEIIKKTDVDSLYNTYISIANALGKNIMHTQRSFKEILGLCIAIGGSKEQGTIILKSLTDIIVIHKQNGQLSEVLEVSWEGSPTSIIIRHPSKGLKFLPLGEVLEDAEREWNIQKLDVLRILNGRLKVAWILDY